MLDMKEKPKKATRGRPLKPLEEAKARDGRAYTIWFNWPLWGRLLAFCKSLPYGTEYKEHIEKALDEYLTKKGFPAAEEADK